MPLSEPRTRRLLGGVQVIGRRCRGAINLLCGNSSLHIFGGLRRIRTPTTLRTINCCLKLFGRGNVSGSRVCRLATEVGGYLRFRFNVGGLCRHVVFATYTLMTGHCSTRFMTSKGISCSRFRRIVLDAVGGRVLHSGERGFGLGLLNSIFTRVGVGLGIGDRSRGRRTRIERLVGRFVR